MPSTPTRPTLFVGSSAEHIDFARAVRARLYDLASALGAYVNKVFEGSIDAFIAASRDECLKRIGPGTKYQKTTDDLAESFGAGKAILLPKPLGNAVPVALVSTTTQRAGQGLVAKTSYLFEAIGELVSRLADTRIRNVVLPILGAGHGRIEPAAAFVSLLLAISDAARHAPGGKFLRKATNVVFQKDQNSKPIVDTVIVRRALALVSSGLSYTHGRSL